jgi:hypothetical protein
LSQSRAIVAGGAGRDKPAAGLTMCSGSSSNLNTM